MEGSLISVRIEWPRRLLRKKKNRKEIMINILVTEPDIELDEKKKEDIRCNFRSDNSCEDNEHLRTHR